MLESIEKLRDYISTNQRMRGWKDNLSDIADEIEREISERYMLLPVDADGVPWGEADKAFYANGENFARRLAGFSYAFEEGRWLLEDGDCCTFYADECRHVKTDPVRELLEDFAGSLQKARDFKSHEDMEYTEDDVLNAYADKFRELLGGDSE